MSVHQSSTTRLKYQTLSSRLPEKELLGFSTLTYLNDRYEVCTHFPRDLHIVDKLVGMKLQQNDPDGDTEMEQCSRRLQLQVRLTSRVLSPALNVASLSGIIAALLIQSRC